MLHIVLSNRVENTGGSILAVWIVSVFVAIVCVIAASAHSFVAIRSDGIRIGFWPIVSRTIPWDQIVEVEAIFPLAATRRDDGFGVHGNAQSQHGKRYSSGGEHGVSIRTTDRNRYIVVFHKPVDEIVERIEAEMARRQTH